MIQKQYKLYPFCQITIGKTRSLIVNLQKRNMYFIPNALAKYLLEIKVISQSNLEKYFLSDYNAAIEYIDYLKENRLLYDIDSYPQIVEQKKDYDNWYKISNAIIELNPNLNLTEALSKIDDLGVKAIEFRNFSKTHFEDILIYLNVLSESNVRHIEIVTPFSEVLLQMIKSGHRRVKLLHFFDCKHIHEEYIQDIDLGVIYTSIELSSKCCGSFAPNYFNLTKASFMESYHHNSCLNRKISIDAEGNIKNCPSMSVNFGNIKDTTLAEAIEKPGFKKYWDINKDKIHVCKDCEFRYICTDCRAYVEDPEDILSKPLKCGYNPYTGEWSEWSTNPLKQKAIDFYEMGEMIEKEK